MRTVNCQQMGRKVVDVCLLNKITIPDNLALAKGNQGNGLITGLKQGISDYGNRHVLFSTGCKIRESSSS